MDRNFKPPFYERRYIASAPSLSIAAELSKSCGLVAVLDGRVGGGAEIAGARRGWRSRRSVELRASGAVGLRWQAIFGSSDRKVHARHVDNLHPPLFRHHRERFLQNVTLNFSRAGHRPVVDKNHAARNLEAGEMLAAIVHDL
jgi:hypothetical protein